MAKQVRVTEQQLVELAKTLEGKNWIVSISIVDGDLVLCPYRTGELITLEGK